MSVCSIEKNEHLFVFQYFCVFFHLLVGINKNINASNCRFKTSRKQKVREEKWKINSS